MEQGIFPHDKSFGSDEEFEEERRLCYVGMTRAQKRLFLSHAQQRNIFGFSKNNSVSIFIKEIPTECLKHRAAFSITKPREISSERITSFLEKRERLRQSKGIVSVRTFNKSKKGRPPKKSFQDLDDYVCSGTKASPEDLIAGAIVFHSNWGKGKILQTEGNGDMMKVVVDFRGQKKKLMVQYANLMI